MTKKNFNFEYWRSSSGTQWVNCTSFFLARVNETKKVKNPCSKCCPNGTASILPGLFSTLTLWCWASSREAVMWIPVLKSLVCLESKPESTAPATDARTTGPFEMLSFSRWLQRARTNFCHLFFLRRRRPYQEGLSRNKENARRKWKRYFAKSISTFSFLLGSFF